MIYLMNELILSRHSWLISVAVTVVNALIFKFRSIGYIREHPALASGYRRLFWGYLLWTILPWLIIGFGIEIGGVPDILSYLRPSEGNPFVIAFFAVIFVLWIFGGYWLFARRGAEFLSEHPGWLRPPPKDPLMIKGLYCLMVTVGVIAMVLMFSGIIGPIGR